MTTPSDQTPSTPAAPADPAPTPDPVPASTPTPAASNEPPKPDPPAPAAEPPKADPVPAPAPVAANPATPPEPSTPPTPSEVDLLNNPDVQKLLEQRAKKAVGDAKTEWTSQAEQAAERATMEEIDRIKAEKGDAETARDGYKTQIGQLQADNAFNAAVMASGQQLANAGAAKFLRMAVDEIRSTREITWEEAVKEAAETNAYLIKQPDAGGSVAPATTIPTTPKGTETPAEPTPPVAVDARKMSKADYAKYRREVHKIN